MINGIISNLQYWEYLAHSRSHSQLAVRGLWCAKASAEMDEVFAHQCVQEMQICSVGGRPTGTKQRNKVGNPLAWAVFAEDNEADEADRQSHCKDGEQVAGP